MDTSSHALSTLQRPTTQRNATSATHADTPLAATLRRVVRRLPASRCAANGQSTTGVGRSVVVIPAHNEHRRLPATLAALDRQTHQPDAVVVVADNCTDGTAQLARDCGATVVETVANHDAKAGALNAALEVLLDGLDDHDTVLAMDADTELDEHFVADARQRLAEDHDETIGGVGGVFYGNGERWKLVRQLQANEYTRYARQLARRRGRALVLTGTGTLFRVKALRQVVAARRSGALPDPGGTAGVYDTGALTEDNELTLALKHLGWRARSPRDCIVHTAMMPTWRQLFTQRRRWQRGALENLAHHGIHRHTWPYALRQIGTYLGVLFIPLYVATLATALITGRGVAFVVPLWITVAVVYVVEQTWSVRHGGWRAMLVSVTVIPELIYTLFLNTVYTVCLVGLLAGTAERWGRGVDQAHAQAQAQAQAQAHAQAQANGTSGFGRRRGPHIAVRAPATGAGMTFVTAAIVGLPIVDIALAWDLLAIFVLTGFAFTVVRLVPVPTS